MAAVKSWTVDIDVREHDDERLTRAQAQLRSPGHPQLLGIGVARRNPDDPEVPEIGDEIAAARALNDLAGKLRQTASADLEQVTHEPAHLQL